jgi:hypothetical protein
MDSLPPFFIMTRKGSGTQEHGYERRLMSLGDLTGSNE